MEYSQSSESATSLQESLLYDCHQKTFPFLFFSRLVNYYYYAIFHLSTWCPQIFPTFHISWMFHTCTHLFPLPAPALPLPRLVVLPPHLHLASLSALQIIKCAVHSIWLHLAVSLRLLLSSSSSSSSLWKNKRSQLDNDTPYQNHAHSFPQAWRQRGKWPM